MCSSSYPPAADPRGRHGVEHSVIDRGDEDERVLEEAIRVADEERAVLADRGDHRALLGLAAERCRPRSGMCHDGHLMRVGKIRQRRGISCGKCNSMIARGKWALYCADPGCLAIMCVDCVRVSLDAFPPDPVYGQDRDEGADHG